MYNGNYWEDYSQIILETPQEREAKRKQQKNTFSRVFLALSLYLIISSVLVNGIYILAQLLMSEERYFMFTSNNIIPLIISAGIQYVLMLPLFMLMTSGMRKAENKEVKKLSAKEFILFLLVGETFMYAGALIGNTINSFIGSFLGDMPENSLNSTVSTTPVWLIILLMVIVAPIVEELIFRKIIIDRLSVFGDRNAIIFSSVAFGLIHVNLYQFFYATALGFILGYVYTKTRNVKYSIFMHMLINFLGSVVVIFAQDAIYTLIDDMTNLANGITVDLVNIIFNAGIYMVYSSLQMGMVIGGIIVLYNYIKQKKITVSNDKDIFLPDSEIFRGGIVNFGSILFLAVTAIFIFLNIFQ